MKGSTDPGGQLARRVQPEGVEAGDLCAPPGDPVHCRGLGFEPTGGHDKRGQVVAAASPAEALDVDDRDDLAAPREQLALVEVAVDQVVPPSSHVFHPGHPGLQFRKGGRSACRVPPQFDPGGVAGLEQQGAGAGAEVPAAAVAGVARPGRLAGGEALL